MPVAAGDGMGILSQCTYRCVVFPDNDLKVGMKIRVWSQCTYRCVVLPDVATWSVMASSKVSMHLQVHGAP